MRRVLTLWTIALCGMAAMAAPLDPTPYVYENQGAPVTLQNIGDEHYSRVQTVDGFLVIRDSLGVFYFADETGEASPVKAKDESVRTLQENTFLKNLDVAKSRENHFSLHPGRFNHVERNSSVPAPWVSNKVESGDRPPVLRLPPSENYTKGTNRFVAILLANDEHANLDSLFVWKLLNQEDYKTSTYVGSVHDYFKDQSMGKFVPTFDVFSVKVNKKFSDYKNHEYDLVKVALTALSEKYPSLDASPYDSDGDGFVDAFAVLYAGKPADAGDIRSFQYELRYETTTYSFGGKKFNNYIFISQQDYVFSTFIHEFSHSMGLRDHYCVRASDCYDNFANTPYQAPGAHAWDVMASGAHRESGRRPPGYNAFERNFMGWLKYDSLDLSADMIALSPLSESNQAYKIPVPGKNDEWFIIENRQKINKWDESLPGHGLLIWHIDYDYSSWNKDALNDDKTHQRVDLVEAGDQKVTDYTDGYRGYHQGDDPFPGTQKVTEFSGFKSWGGTDLGVNLYGIMEEGYNACFTTKEGVSVTTCKTTDVNSSSSAKSSSSIVSSSSSSSIIQSAAEGSSSSVKSSSSSASDIWSWFDQKFSSSSAVANSSSSIIPSSSSSVIPSSSSSVIPSAVEESSLATPGVEFHLADGSLQIVVRGPARRNVTVFDMLGNRLHVEEFYSSNYTVNLKPFVGKVLLVRVTENGRLLKQSRVAVR